MPLISGQWKLKDISDTPWTDTTSIRVCMQMGTEEGYQQRLDQIRFYRLGKEDEYWFVQSLKETELDGPLRFFGEFCQKKITDNVFDNSGLSGIELGKSTIDYDNKELTLKWTRPFDVSADGSLTLDTDTTYYIWMTWVIADDHDTLTRFRWGTTQES